MRTFLLLQHHKMIIKSINSIAINLLSLGLLTICILLLVLQANAQNEDDGWTTPVNLSSSGSTTDPVMVTDATNTTHVIWKDAATGSFAYVQSKPGDWNTTPQSIELPFGTRRYFPDLRGPDPTPLFSPQLIADTESQIHAVWIDDENKLWHSLVPAETFTDFASWASRESLGNFISDFTVAIDDSGQIHLSYIGSPTTDSQPGLYYRQLSDLESEWSAPQLIYGSEYFRKLPPDQANIGMATVSVGNTKNVYIVWDNSSLETIFFTHSNDGGLTWEDVSIIDQRQAEDGPDLTGPRNILLAVNGTDLLLVWQAGHGLSNCDQYFQSSSDGGNTWSTPVIMLGEFRDCPEENHFFDKVADDLILLSTIFQGQFYLQAWNGNRWSDPQAQEMLTTFISPETFRSIDLGCHQFSLLDGGQILAVGCGTATDGQTRDIWQTSRPLGTIADWFPPIPAWSPIVQVTDSAPSASLPKAIADSQGRVHALWSQLDGSNATRTTIYYTQWDSERWTPPLPVLTSPLGNAEQPEVTISDDDRLMVVWPNELGQLYFSQASSDRAIFAADWSTPITLPTPQGLVGGTDISLENDGTIYVTYSMPVNERRGIYLTRSVDDGDSWQDPILIFDGSAADWDVVGEPKLILTDDGVMHLLWTKEVLSTEGLSAQALYYARSEDGGATFSEPQLLAETPISWYGLVSDGTKAVHRLWQEQSASITSVRHQYTINGGRTWSSPARLSSESGPLNVITDNSGQLHAIQGEEGALTYSIWDGSVWRPEEGFQTLPDDDGKDVEPKNIGAAITADQRLTVLYASDMLASDNVQPETGFYASWRSVEVPEEIAIPEPEETESSIPLVVPAEETSVSETTPTISPLPTPTVVVATNINSGTSDQGILGILNTSDKITRTIIAIVPVGLFLIAVFAVVLWLVRSTRN